MTLEKTLMLKEQVCLSDTNTTTVHLVSRLTLEENDGCTKEVRAFLRTDHSGRGDRTETGTSVLASETPSGPSCNKAFLSLSALDWTVSGFE